MKADFDPSEPPAAFVKWLEKASEDERRLHEREFANRSHAAKHVLRATKELRESLTAVDDQRIEKLIVELLELARDLHDYDPTSD